MNFKSSLEVRLLARMLAVLALLFGVCELPLTHAQSQSTQNPSIVKQRIAQGSGKSSKAVAATVNIPEGVSLADGLTEDEAVAGG